MEKIWCYLYTTAEPGVQESMIGATSNSSASIPLAGLGYGLPLARLYAQYFNGDIELVNEEGRGVDAFVRLNRLGDQNEPLV